MLDQEDICDRCGKCCEVCPLFNAETRLCRVYPCRRNVPWCHEVTTETAPALHERGMLPDSCAYLRKEDE
jgi:uncharacterized cysteine cluster protein YcgN (CxxCxxCC family)